LSKWVAHRLEGIGIAAVSVGGSVAMISSRATLLGLEFLLAADNHRDRRGGADAAPVDADRDHPAAHVPERHPDAWKSRPMAVERGAARRARLAVDHTPLG
jgi:hypothetical protein